MRRVIQLMLILVFGFSVISCDPENPGPNPPGDIPEMDGFYFYGSNTLASKSADAHALLPLARLDPAKSGGNTEREGVFGRLIYIGPNSTIQIAELAGDDYTVYGLPNGGELKPGIQLSFTNIASEMIQGILAPDEDPIIITNEGLYYVLVLKERKEIRLMELRPEIIGDATQGGWSTGTPIPLKSISRDSAVFEITQLPLKGSSRYKYRFARGWELYTGANTVTMTNLGNRNYEESISSGNNDIGYYSDSCAHIIDGKYTINLTYYLTGDKWKENKILTGEFPADYTNTEFGLFGNAYLNAAGDTASWRPGIDGYELRTPTMEGNTYTWSWTSISLIKDREFVILENGEWGGMEISYSIADIVTGQAIDDGLIIDAASVGSDLNNFYVATGGTYDIELVFDEDQETITVRIDNS